MKFIGITTKYKVTKEKLKAGISVGIIIAICGLSVVTVNALIDAQETAYKKQSAAQIAELITDDAEETEETPEETFEESEELKNKSKNSELSEPVEGKVQTKGTSETTETDTSAESDEAKESVSESETDSTEATSETSETTSKTSVTETTAETSATTAETTTKQTTSETTTVAAATETTVQATPTPAFTETKVVKFVYAKDKLNVRLGPGLDYDVVKTVEKGGGIDVIGETSNGWYHTYNGNYVSKELCSDTPVIVTATPKPTEAPKETTAATTAQETTAATTTTQATTTTTTAAATQAQSGSERPGMTLYGDCKVTFYGPQPNGDGTYSTGTATGTTCVEGVTVAADWSIFPAGTVLYIENDPLGGDGYYTVEDRGSGVVGNHIDIYADAGESYSTTSCTVYVVN